MYESKTLKVLLRNKDVDRKWKKIIDNLCYMPSRNLSLPLLYDVICQKNYWHRRNNT